MVHRLNEALRFVDRLFHLDDQNLNPLFQIGTLDIKISDRASVEIMFEVENLILQHRQHWIHAIGSPVHRHNQTVKLPSRLPKLAFAAPPQRLILIAVQLSVPFGKQCLANTFDRFDALSDVFRLIRGIVIGICQRIVLVFEIFPPSKSTTD